MSQVERVSAGSEVLGISREFLFYMSLTKYHFVWLQGLDFFVCNFGKRPFFSDRCSPLTYDGKWSGVDLHEDMAGKVIGFNTLHLFPASEVVPRIFLAVKKDSISLADFIVETNRLCGIHDSNLGFKDFFDEHLNNKSVANLQLSFIDTESQKLVSLTRERFVELGGKLLV